MTALNKTTSKYRDKQVLPSKQREWNSYIAFIGAVGLHVLTDKQVSDGAVDLDGVDARSERQDGTLL